MARPLGVKQGNANCAIGAEREKTRKSRNESRVSDWHRSRDSAVHGGLSSDKQDTAKTALRQASETEPKTSGGGAPRVGNTSPTSAAASRKNRREKGDNLSGERPVIGGDGGREVGRHRWPTRARLCRSWTEAAIVRAMKAQRTKRTPRSRRVVRQDSDASACVATPNSRRRDMQHKSRAYLRSRRSAREQTRRSRRLQCNNRNLDPPASRSSGTASPRAEGAADSKASVRLFKD